MGFPILAALLSVSVGHVWIVDDDGGVGVDFTEIQPAVDAASPGDAVWVREGSYGAFEVAKALTVFGETPDRVLVDEAHVNDTAPGQRVSLVALRGPANVERCAGLVTLSDWIGDVSVWSSVDVRAHDLRCDATRCKVTVRGSRLEIVGGRVRALTGDPGDTAIVSDGSLLHVAQVELVRGGNGIDTPYTPGFGANAGHGIFATYSQVLLTGTGQSRIRGGDGGIGDVDPYYDGKSGHGIAAVSGSTLRWSGVLAQTGVCWGQAAGCGVPVLTRFGEQPPVPDPVLETFDRLDGREGVRVFAEPGARVRLELGVTATVAASEGPVEQLLVPLVTHELGIVPSFGVLETVSDHRLADEPALLAQAVVVGRDGHVRRTNSAVWIRVPRPCSDVPVLADCDSDGLDDACEIARGLETDCDGNGIVDACQADPALEDLNEDGVPDACQSFATIRVDDDAPSDPGPGDPLVSDPLEDGSEAHPFDSLAEAVAAFVDGDRIVVEPGLYRGPGNYGLVPSAQSLFIQGAGPSETVVDVEGQGGFLDINGSNYAELTRVRGLGIRQATSGIREYAKSRLEIRDCRFEDSGYPVVTDGQTWIEDCVFVSNAAVRMTGGLGHVLRSTFVGNSDVTGGAIDMYVGDGLIEACTFRANSADYGGAVWVWAEDSEATRIESCLFLDNEAMEGGAVFAVMNGRPATHLLGRSTFSGNRATLGGACLIAPLSEPSVLFVEDCLFWQNQGLVGPDVAVSEGPYSPGSLSDAEIVLRTTNLPGGLAAVPLVPSATLHVNGRMFDVDPLLAPDGHLAPSSPMVDLGTTEPDLGPDAVDFEDDPRLQGEAIDVGADEVPRSSLR